MNKIFATNPKIKLSRNLFDLSCTHKTTFNGSYLIPIKIIENMPGETLSVSMNAVLEMTTPLKPTMDLAVCNVYAFKIPLRLLWEHWKEMWGENNDTYWTQQTQYSVPTLDAPEGGWNKDSIMSKLGVRMNTEVKKLSALPARAIAKIYNEWFRDENVQVPYLEVYDDSNRIGSNGSGKNDLVLGGKCPRIAKFHDLFTTALPGPLKSTEDVLLPLGTQARVITTTKDIDTTNMAALHFDKTQESQKINTGDTLLIGTSEWADGGVLQSYSGLNSGNGQWQANLAPSNLIADLTNAAGATMQDFIYAYNLYRMFTIDARGGSRYVEVLANHYGVLSSDARQQRSEYLGGTNFNINMVQVPQTSQSTEGNPQGYLTAYSNTGVKDKHLFTTSYEEHCYTIIFAAVRTKQTYAQGVEKLWKHLDRTEFYQPVFSNIGEQKILNSEIYAQGTTEDDEGFGFAEAWYEYRTGVDMVTGQFSPDAENSLPSYTYVNDFEDLPTLSEEFILETEDNINRTIAISSDVQDQFKADFYFDIKAARPMPARSIPSLKSHL